MFGRRKKEQVEINTVTQQQESPRMINPENIHESGYALRDEEQIVAVEKVLSPKGDGWLLVTNMVFLYIHDKEGIYLQLNHPMIESLVVEDGSKIKVSWNETIGNFDYQMKVKAGSETAKIIVKQINDTFHYKKSSVQHVTLDESQTKQAREKYVVRFDRMIELEKQNAVRLEPKLDEIADDDPKKPQKKLELLSQINTSRDNIRVYEKNITYVQNMSIIQSYKIPAGVDTGNVWNDCYYDESRKVFVTFRKAYETVSNARTRDIQIKFDKEMGNTAGIIIEEEKITFRFGYPVILREDQSGNPVWSILCTMTDSMLTDKIVLARLKPKSHEESVIYETESEQWISRGKEMKICERESKVAQKHGLSYKQSMELTKQLAGRPYDAELLKKELSELEQ